MDSAFPQEGFWFQAGERGGDEREREGERKWKGEGKEGEEVEEERGEGPSCGAQVTARRWVGGWLSPKTSSNDEWGTAEDHPS